MSRLFEESDFNGDISQWDVSNVTTMEKMFRKSKFTGDISQWNVSKVTNMEGCFSRSKFNGDISNWDVSSVTNMRSMFYQSHFNGDISKWNVGKVINMRTLFYESEFRGDISRWNVSNVENMYGMFGSMPYKCDLSGWDVSKVSNIACMFNGIFSSPDDNCYIGDFSKWKIQKKNADDIKYLFEMKAYSNEEMSGIKSRMFRKIINACPKDREELEKSLKEAKSFGINDLNFIDVSNITDMSHLFEESDFNGDTSKWEVSKVTNMDSMFENSKFNGDISKWDVSHVKNMKNMFHNSKFSGDISKWNVSNVTDMEGMFEGSNFNGDISSWDVSKVENMTAMFKDSKFHGDISEWTLAPKSSGIFTNSGFSEEEINALLCKPFTDPRDGQAYKVCRIGDQIWMAENLRYRCKKGGSFAYDDDASNVPKYGRLYQKGVANEACPPGWHLPSKEEFETMIKFVEKEYDVSDALRAVEWKDGIDAYGFFAVPAGIYFDDDEFWLMGKAVEMWTSSQKCEECSYFFEIAVGTDSDGCGIRYNEYRPRYCSIRCIKD